MNPLVYLQQFILSARFALLLVFISFIAIILTMIYTSPLSLGPAGMLLAFLAFYLWFFSVFLVMFHAVKTLVYKKAGRSTQITGRFLMLCAAWAFAPLILLALQSIGQLDVISTGLVILFEGLVSAYIIKR